MENELGHCLVIVTEQTWSMTRSILLTWRKGFSRLHSPVPWFIPAQASLGRNYWLCDTNLCSGHFLGLWIFIDHVWKLQLKKKILPEYVIFIIRSVTILYQGSFKRFQRVFFLILVFPDGGEFHVFLLAG